MFLFLLPILFSLQAVGSLFVYPRQLRAILGNKMLRRNHALEHATIVVMMEREPGRKLNGFSNDDGRWKITSIVQKSLRSWGNAQLHGGSRGA